MDGREVDDGCCEGGRVLEGYSKGTRSTLPCTVLDLPWLGKGAELHRARGGGYSCAVPREHAGRCMQPRRRVPRRGLVALYQTPGMPLYPQVRVALDIGRGEDAGVLSSTWHAWDGMGVVMGVCTKLLSVLLPSAKYFIPHGHLPGEWCIRPTNYRTAPLIAPGGEKSSNPIHHTRWSTAIAYRAECR